METGRDIRVYGTLVNYTLDSEISDTDHNDALANAYQLYDARFGEATNVDNFQDVINKRLTAISYANGITTIRNRAGVQDGSPYMFIVDGDSNVKGDLVVDDNLHVQDNLTVDGNTTIRGNIQINGTISGGTLRSLTDVNVTGLTNGSILKYNSSTSKWVVGTDKDTDTKTLAALTDVDTSGVVNNSVLKYNSSSHKWIVATDNDTNTKTLAGLTDVTTTGATTGSVLKYNASTSKWEIGQDSTGSAGVTTLAALTDVDTAGAASNSVLKYNATSHKWVVGTDANTKTLSGLTDVDTTGVANNSVLKYSSSQSKWVIGTDNAGSSAPTTLASLTDTSVSGAIDGSYLVYDSATSKWTIDSQYVAEVNMRHVDSNTVTLNDGTANGIVHDSCRTGYVYTIAYAPSWVDIDVCYPDNENSDTATSAKGRTATKWTRPQDGKTWWTNGIAYYAKEANNTGSARTGRVILHCTPYLGTPNTGMVIGVAVTVTQPAAS